MIQPMSRDEMIARAKELFGNEAEVHYSNGQWSIDTGVEERFDEEDYFNRDAWETYANNSGGENQLERWGYKNGYSGRSIAELFDAYDEEAEATSRRIVAEVRRDMAAGLDYEGAGLADWRDRVLKYAEERGW